MWAFNSVFYQIYTLGFCGAPFANDKDPEEEMAQHRIRKVTEWIPHMKKLGIDAVYFCPLFESDTHGYNTRDYKKIGSTSIFTGIPTTTTASGTRDGKEITISSNSISATRK